MMKTQPLVSIVIPTWQRHDLLMETIEHINNQTYSMKEIIVVCDGQDQELWQRLDDNLHIRCSYCNEGSYDVTFINLGRNWSGLDSSSFGIAPLLVGYLCARGDYIMHLSDDDRIAPDYIERLVDLLDETNADFAYSKARFFWHDQKPEDGIDIGTDPPQHGQITSYLFRPSNLYKYGYPRFNSHPMDWSLVSDWMSNGATWAFLPEVLFWHCANDESGRRK